MWRLRAVFAVLLFSSAVSASRKYYNGYELLEVQTETARDREAITFLTELDSQIDVWYKVPEAVHLFVPPDNLQDLKEFLTRNGLEYSVINDHIQRDIEEETTRLRAKGASSKAYNFDDFNSLDQIINEMYAMVARCPTSHGVNCEIMNLGQALQGHDMLVFRMWREGSGRKAVWIDATIHAREWLSTATHMKIVKHLVDDYTTDSEVQTLVDTYDWYLMPVVNPDGYDYTWTDDRLWRKNLSPNAGTQCQGTDLNRNYNIEWGEYGGSHDPCRQDYYGSDPTSELETQALSRQVVLLSGALLCTFHLHTYGQLWIVPYGIMEQDQSQCLRSPDYDELMTVANLAANAVENTYGTTWRRGSLCEEGQPVAGVEMDFYKQNGPVKFAFTAELRGDNFVVPAYDIQPSFEEIWNGITTTIANV